MPGSPWTTPAGSPASRYSPWRRPAGSTRTWAPARRSAPRDPAPRRPRPQGRQLGRAARRARAAARRPLASQGRLTPPRRLIIHPGETFRAIGRPSAWPRSVPATPWDIPSVFLVKCPVHSLAFSSIRGSIGYEKHRRCDAQRFRSQLSFASPPRVTPWFSMVLTPGRAWRSGSRRTFASSRTGESATSSSRK